MTHVTNLDARKKAMKEIILALHKGLSAAAAKERFEKEVGDVSSSEIAEMEQALINEGMSADEIKMFCNVHALIFQSSLEKAAIKDTSPSHPIYLFKQENREVEKLIKAVKATVEKSTDFGFPALRQTLREQLTKLKGVEKHYERKEQILFPVLEKKGFMGPSKVMWGKDNEIRELFRAALSDLDNVKDKASFERYRDMSLNPLLQEVDGMIFKEENILFPTCLEKLTPGDWVEILRESAEVGYVFIEPPKETEFLVKELQAALLEEPIARDSTISFPSGSLPLKELMCLLNTLPVDLTFVDKNDKVAYYTEGKSRIFTRTRSVIGRKVQNCHPPQSVHVVEKILSSFKDGSKDHFDFWINLGGRFIYIRYFAVRDKERRYLGTLEVSQDLTEERKLQGQRRLLEEESLTP